MMMSYKGISASPGIAIAKAVVFKKDIYIPAPNKVLDTISEWNRYEAAREGAKLQIENIYHLAKQKMGEEHAEIFEGHLLIIDDPELHEGIELAIKEEKYNAEFALHQTTSQFISLLLELDDEMLRARATDIQDITSRIMSQLRGVAHVDLSLLDQECIIVADDLTPSDTAQLNLKVIKGFITEAGSRTSHSAIMARSLEIPAIVGIGGSIFNIQQGDLLVVDATKGEVLSNPEPAIVEAFQHEKLQYDEKIQQLRKLVNMPTISLDKHHVELAANIGKLEDIDRAIENGAEAIGLFRTEFLYMGRTQLPTEEEQYTSYKYALEKMNGKPVVIRTLDIGGDKELPYLQLPKEVNPFLGQRALRFCLANPALFRTQLRALLRASVHGNLKIMFPMIAVLEELLDAKRLLEEEKHKLLQEGIKVNEVIEIGMMVEIPSVAISADLFAPHIDFFSIGTNDLIQYTMAADRMNETLTYLYQPLHPSILRLIKNVIDAANEHGKWVGMCGEMAGDQNAVPLLLGLGLHEFSMSASSILPTRALIHSLHQAEWNKAVKMALNLPTSDAIIQFVEEKIEME